MKTALMKAGIGALVESTEGHGSRLAGYPGFVLEKKGLNTTAYPFLSRQNDDAVLFIALLILTPDEHPAFFLQHPAV